MKRYFLYQILLTISILGMSSCMSGDKIKVEEITSMKMRGSTMSQTGVDITAMVINSGNKITLLDGSLTLYSGDKEVLEIALRDKSTIHRKSHESVFIPLVIRYKNGLGPLSIIPLSVGGMDNIFISGNVKVRGGLLSKRVKIKKMRLDEFSFQYGADLKALINDAF